MGLPFPQILGDVEVEERRPRYWNEPRRKRLSFVKSRSSSNRHNSDKWALMPKFQPGQQPRNEQERWDLRQFEAQRRFQENDLRFDHERRVRHAQHMHQLQMQQAQQQAAYMHRPAVPPQHGQEQLRGQHHPHPIEMRPHHASSDDEIVAIEGGSSDSDGDSSDDHSHHHHAPKKTPRYLEIEPKKQKQIKLKKKDKSGHKKKNRGGSKHRRYEAYEDSSSSSSEDSFDEAIRNRRVRGKSRAPRSRSRARFVDSSSDDSFDEPSYRRINGGKHRGRHGSR